MRTRGRPVAKLLAIPFARRFACRIASVSALVSVLVSALGPGSLSGILFACLSTSVLATPSGAAVTLQVSAAASLSNTMSEMKALFLLQNPGIGLALDFGSSGILQAQIEQGAPVDVFVSAGTRQMDALVAKGLVDSAEVRILARNTLVLVAPALKGGFSREARLASIRTLEDLAEP